MKLYGDKRFVFRKAGLGWGISKFRFKWFEDWGLIGVFFMREKIWMGFLVGKKIILRNEDLVEKEGEGRS